MNFHLVQSQRVEGQEAGPGGCGNSTGRRSATQCGPQHFRLLTASCTCTEGRRFGKVKFRHQVEQGRAHNSVRLARWAHIGPVGALRNVQLPAVTSKQFMAKLRLKKGTGLSAKVG